MKKSVLLLILDGYGLAPAGAGNAVSLAKMPCLDSLIGLPCASNFGVIRLDASGRATGLPQGAMGNSEVGHLNIGAGRIVYQDITRIDLAIENGNFASNPAICNLLAAVRASGGRLHLMGLLSDGGVHSHIRHLEALLQLALAAEVPVALDLFLDGRDTAPTSGMHFVTNLQTMLADMHRDSCHICLNTLCGRFYAMDRDKRWERVKLAWDLIVHGNGEHAADPIDALRASYARGEGDEFVRPLLFGKPVEDGDGIFFFNFRADRARELVSAFHYSDFDFFDRGRLPELAGLATMTSYDAQFALPVAFAKHNIAASLGEIVSDMGLRQLRLAETEKYAHVTYFFSGGREEPFEGEDRILIASPRDVPTYDCKPEMSVHEVTDKLLAAWENGNHGEHYALAVCNFANPDMVGHTGKIPATVAALEAVDACVKRVLCTVQNTGGYLVITADHGNCEEMLDAHGHPQTAHTCNQVPFLIFEAAGRNYAGHILPLHGSGKLGDIAPTLLSLMGIKIPSAMTGHNLLETCA